MWSEQIDLNEISSEKTFNYEGTITDVNEYFCEFTLDNKYTVLFYDKIKEKGLPSANQTIKLTNILFDRNFIIVKSTSQITCSNYQNSGERSLQFVEEYKSLYNLDEILLIKKVIDRYKRLKIFNNFPVTIDEVFLRAFQYLRLWVNEVSNFDDVEFFFPLKFSIVVANDLITKENEFLFSVQHSNVGQYFIAYFYYNKTKYSLVLCDGQKDIVCQTFKNEEFDFKDFVNKFVLIKKFIYVVEHFKDNQNFEYVLFDLKDVYVLDLLEKDENEMKMKGYDFSAVIKNRCPIYWHDFNKRYEFWLHVYLRQIHSECFIKSPIFSEFYYLLNVGSELSLKLQCVMPMVHYVERKNFEVNRVLQIKKMMAYSFPIVQMEVRENSTETDELMSLDKINFGANQSVDFVAIIKEKTLTPPLNSRTTKMSNNPLFGTTGRMSHTLKLRGIDSQCSYTMYLTNIENSLCPIGLVPNMKINVRNALTQNNYLKSCLATSFEIVEYNERINISHNVDWNWGEPTMISSLRNPPIYSKIWGHIEWIYLTQVNFYTICKICRNSLPPLRIRCCREMNFEHSLKFIFYGNDLGGKSEIQCENFDVLCCIALFHKDAEKRHLWNMFVGLRQYSFNHYKEKDIQDNRNKNNDLPKDPSQVLDYLFSTISNLFNPIDIRIKQDSHNSYWMCTEARTTISGRTAYGY